jgi:hypothetical protein
MRHAEATTPYPGGQLDLLYSPRKGCPGGQERRSVGMVFFRQQ